MEDSRFKGLRARERKRVSAKKNVFRLTLSRLTAVNVPLNNRAPNEPKKFNKPETQRPYTLPLRIIFPSCNPSA